LSTEHFLASQTLFQSENILTTERFRISRRPLFVMSAIPKLPTSFPRAPSACKAVAEPFFSCLNTHSVKTDPNDKDASRRGLLACVKELKLYDDCMTKFETKHDPKRFRVQEEYRKNTQK
jgi:hypothetical protein